MVPVPTVQGHGWQWPGQFPMDDGSARDNWREALLCAEWMQENRQFCDSSIVYGGGPRVRRAGGCFCNIDDIERLYIYIYIRVYKYIYIYILQDYLFIDYIYIYMFRFIVTFDFDSQ